MNDTAPQDPAPEAPAGDSVPLRGKVDLETVNALQHAVLERARRADERGRWWPQITPAQWIVSVLIAVVLVAGIFNVVDAGLTAFQKFAEVSMRPSPQPPAEPTPPLDPSQPIAVMVVPAISPVTESDAPASR